MSERQKTYQTKFEKTVRIKMPRQALYMYWRDFENLPNVMSHLESVRDLDGRRSHWTAKAPLGKRVEWDAEIVTDVPGEAISWRALEGSDVENAGSVRFDDAPEGGTDVKVEISYNPPAGAVGETFAKLLGSDPAAQVERDLKKFREFMEEGMSAAERGEDEAYGEEFIRDESPNSGRAPGTYNHI